MGKNYEAIHVIDALFEILVRVDPTTIFNCILVSKEWSEVITGPGFRQKYLNSWKSHPKLLVGFFTNSHGGFINLWQRHDSTDEVQFIPTNKFGRNIKAGTSIPRLGYFISKSSDNGLILTGGYPNTFYVSHPISGLRIQLPPPPYPKFQGDECLANIISDDPLNPSSFKVILAEISFPKKRTLIIHTYCSKTKKWEDSELSCSTGFSLQLTGYGRNVGAGTVTKGGVVYWDAIRDDSCCLAAYDTITGNLSFVLEPGFEAVKDPFYVGRENHGDIDICHQTFYGISDHGSLCCATVRFEVVNHKKACSEGMINVWGLDHDDDGRKYWNLLYTVGFETIWAENSLVSKAAAKPRMPFDFLSFVPEKSDSAFLRLDKEIFVYHFDTNKLEKILELSPLQSYAINYHPVTMRELGV